MLTLVAVRFRSELLVSVRLSFVSFACFIWRLNSKLKESLDIFIDIKASSSSFPLLSFLSFNSKISYGRSPV
uniref:Uncharacterized protein n=1 Tax=Rhizophora mucronata TaxID=61149 RepID=A0A2P2P0W6_RHIMU